MGRSARVWLTAALCLAMIAGQVPSYLVGSTGRAGASSDGLGAAVAAALIPPSAAGSRAVRAVNDIAPVAMSTTIRFGQVGPAQLNSDSQGCTACTSFQSQTDPASPSYAAPADGTITAWSVQGPTDVCSNCSVKLRIFRRTVTGEFVTVAESPTQAVDTGLKTFAASIPVLAGDMLGIDATNGLRWYAGASGDQITFITGDPTPGATTIGQCPPNPPAPDLCWFTNPLPPGFLTNVAATLKVGPPDDYALSFNGVPDYTTGSKALPSSSLKISQALADTFTLDAWVKWLGVGSYVGVLSLPRGLDSEVGTGVTLALDHGAPCLALQFPTAPYQRFGGCAAGGAPVLAPFRWTHIVASYDGRTASITVDGQAVAHDYGTCQMVPLSNNTFVIGSEFQNLTGFADRHFGGDIDDVVISHGAPGHPTVCSDRAASTVAQWNFDEGVGTTSFDANAGPALTLYNGTNWVVGRTGKRTISGTVRNDLESPIGNVEVRVVPHGSGFPVVASGRTDEQGTYTLAVAVNEVYDVAFYPPEGSGFAVQFYPDQVSPADAVGLLVADTDLVGIDASLLRAYVLSGKVTDVSGAALANIGVWANIGSAPCCFLIRGTSTNADGRYSLELAPGVDYKIQVAPGSPRETWWNGHPNPGNDTFTGWSSADAIRMETTTRTCADTSSSELVNTWNTDGVLGGGTQPSFTTPGGNAFCVTEIDTYHWNGGNGATPGTVTLAGSPTAGPFSMAGSNPQSLLQPPFVNWFVYPPRGSAIIQGATRCVDSDPSTWSQDARSLGFGFCKVFGVPTVARTAPGPRPNIDVVLGSAISGIARCRDLSRDLIGSGVALLSGSATVGSLGELAGGAFVFPNTAPNAKYRLTYSGSTLVADKVVRFSCSVNVSTDAAGNAVAPAGSLILDLHNHTWTTAFQLPLTVGAPLGVTRYLQVDFVAKSGQSDWYRFHIAPGEKVLIKLTGTNGTIPLPADLALVLFKDIRAYLNQAKGAVGGSDPLRAIQNHDAATAPDAFSPDSYSPDSFSPAAEAPDSFSADVLSPDSFSPDSFSPDSFSPDSFSPDAYSPDSFSPDSFSPDSYSGAQTATLLRVSDHKGTSPEQIIQNTWSNTGDFYIRVRGHNGAFSASDGFTVTAEVTNTACTGAVLQPYAASAGPAGTPTTLILTNTARFGGPVAPSYLQRLNAFAALPSVRGLVIDLATNTGLTPAYAQWDAAVTCPTAANLVAEAIKPLVDQYRPALRYVVLAGGDHVVPYYRTPDQAGLGNEAGFQPGLFQNTPGEASLMFGYTLTQDFYGTRYPIAHFDHTFFMPDLPVGRLVESSTDILAVIDAYTAAGGVVHVGGGRALVSGYDFLADTATFVQTSLSPALTVDSLIQQRHPATSTTPASIDPAWTAEQLKALLFARHYDIASLNGHFSANTLLASDFATRISTDDVAPFMALFRNSLVISTGCHSGYNLVDSEALPTTKNLDWAQLLARAGAETIGSTGYAYGDTDFIKYTELIVANFTTELRYDSGAIAIGTALVNAKHAYVGGLPALRGIDEKALMEASLYGLPMWSIDIGTAGRLVRPGTGSGIVPTSTTIAGLSTATLAPSYVLHQHVVPQDGGPAGTYYDADGNVAVAPKMLVLPVTAQNVGVAGQNARGVVLMDATYVDQGNVTPFTDVASTELAGLHSGFASPVFAPVRTFGLNSLAGMTTFVTTPAQFKSTGANIGTLRRWTSERFQLFYSSRTDATAALAGSPVVYGVRALRGSGGTVRFELTVGALVDPGFAAAYLTYTAEHGTQYGSWHSVAMTQQGSDTVTTRDPLTGAPTSVTRTYAADVLPAGGASPEDVRAFVQAVGGNGLVSMNTNNGEYYRFEPAVASTSSPKQTTAFAITADAHAAYLGSTTVRATLSAAGTGLAGLPVTLTLGAQRADVLTDATGQAAGTFIVTTLPGPTTITAGFAEDATHLGTAASVPFTVDMGAPSLTPGGSTVQYSDGLVVATLKLGGASDPQAVTLAANGLTIAASSDALGRIRLDTRDLPLTPGVNNVLVTFGGNARFNAATLTLAVTMTAEDATATLGAFTPQPNGPLTATVQVTQAADGSLGDLTKAQVTFVLRNAANSALSTIVSTVSAAGASMATFASVAAGVDRVEATVTGGFFASPTVSAVAIVFDPTRSVRGDGALLTTPASTGFPAGRNATFELNARYASDSNEDQGGQRGNNNGDHQDRGSGARPSGPRVPTGSLVFQVTSDQQGDRRGEHEDAGFTFNATSFSWLVISGTTAELRGTGTIRGTAGTFSFAVVASDLPNTGRKINDTFEIRIWNAASSIDTPLYRVAGVLRDGTVVIR